MTPINASGALSTVTTTVQVVPRTLLDLSLRAVRVPVDLAARASGQQANAQWPPVVAFEGFEAAVETTVGGWLHDPAISDKGRLRQAKLAELRKAAGLAEVAAAQRTEAEQTFADRAQRAEDAKQEATQRAEQQKHAAEQAAAKAERRAQTRAAKQQTAEQKAEDSRNKAIDRQERSRTLAALNQESQALTVVKEAQRADEQVQNVDEALEHTKAARKAK